MKQFERTFLLDIISSSLPSISVRCVAIAVGPAGRGWSLTLAGLGQAALWVFAPIPVAHVAAMAVVAGATLVTAGYGGWVALSCR